jgi:outer membrane protein insertion porin family
MKAASSFMGAASAVALSAGIVLSGSIGFQLAAMSVAEAAVVSRIEVRGNRRVDAETIRNYVAIRPGANFSGGDIDEAVKRLFATGLFSDVRINQSGGTLIINVDEYAVINQVVFQGNRKIKDDALAGKVQLRPRGSYSSALMDADIQTIRDAYARIGRDDAVVTGEAREIGDGRVNVIYNIQEGGRTKIASIAFEGNSAYSDGRLREVIATKQTNILSFLSRNDIYDEDRLRADEESLRRFYYNRGYADFRIISAYGELDETTNEYSIYFTVDEGQRYRFGDVEIDVTIDGLTAEDLRSTLESRSGDYYSAEDVEDSILGLSERVAALGYAFAQVTPRGDRNFENQTISVVYTIDQGPRAYVQRIEIRGNERTRDYVIRREFDISEGDAFNQVLIARAKRRLEQLDFFTAVNVSTVPGSEPDQVIVVIDVIEKSTGELSIGGGYATGSGPEGGFSVEGSVAERNFLGRGQTIRLAVSGGRNARDYNFSFTEPYFLGRRISAGFDIFRRTRNYSTYNSELTGGTVRFGLPITQALTTQLAYNFTQEKYAYDEDCDVNGNGILDPAETACNVSPALQNAIENDSPWTKSSVSGSLVFNTIDDMRNPRDGIFSNFTTEVAGLGGDAQWAKFTARASYYKTISDELDLVGLVTAGAGHIMPFGDEDLRVFDHFQNDTRMIRGFKYNGFGPNQSNLAGGVDHLGGTTYFNASAEMQFPIPVLPSGFGMRGAVFADAATLYGNKVAVGPGDPAIVGTDMAWRASVGASLIWASPFGPLRVDYAVPVVKEDDDLIQNFNFGISTRF